MATIEKRTTDSGTSYRVKVRLTGYPPETATFERLTDARAWAAKTESDMKEGRHFGQSKRHAFSELADEYAPHAKDAPRLEYWREVFGTERLADITPARIAKERDKLLSEGTGRKDAATGELKKRTGATVNRYLAALSSCLSYGVKELQWLERNPMERVRKPAENKGRVRFLSDDERAALLEACRPHADLYLAVVLSLTTGARQAEIMGLRWGQIDFARQVISLQKTKNGDRRALPLVGQALDLLRERGRVRTLGDDRIFPPSARARKSDYLDLRDPWTKALKTAGIEDFHWHDLRHTAASYLAMSGVSLVEIAKVLGHRTLQMVARYSHLSDGHIVATGQKLADRMGVGNE
jgi:integrase